MPISFLLMVYVNNGLPSYWQREKWASQTLGDKCSCRQRIFPLQGGLDYSYLFTKHPSLTQLFSSYYSFNWFIVLQKQAGADSSVLLLRMDFHGWTKCPGKWNYPKVSVSLGAAVLLCRIPWIQGHLSPLCKVRCIHRSYRQLSFPVVRMKSDSNRRFLFSLVQSLFHCRKQTQQGRKR